MRALSLFFFSVILMSLNAHAVPMAQCQLSSIRIDKNLSDSDLYTANFSLVPGLRMQTVVSTSSYSGRSRPECREVAGDVFDFETTIDNNENISVYLEGAAPMSRRLGQTLNFRNYFLQGALTCVKKEVSYYLRTLNDGGYSTVVCEKNLPTNLAPMRGYLMGVQYNSEYELPVCFVGDSQKVKADLEDLVAPKSNLELKSASKDAFNISVKWLECVEEGPATSPNGGPCIKEEVRERAVDFKRCDSN